ncbi:jg23604 [Pararge aegeria aegeria]|uniref:Jg23604 protein n=1 Tax=Pararge aegeria aegeria TaxID=348720 RepID=A0A8S4SMT2_9NEOP|nr:jg23604 [Pararge aegeria aegeria]
MWALPVLRTRSYLGTVEFYAHAASSGSLSPCDLYLVNLGSVVRCETFIRPPSSRAIVVFRLISEGKRVKKMAGGRQRRG